MYEEKEKKEQMIIGFDHFLQYSQQSIKNTSNAKLGSVNSFLFNKRQMFSNY